jgi:hypothetical protein
VARLRHPPINSQWSSDDMWFVVVGTRFYYLSVSLCICSQEFDKESPLSVETCFNLLTNCSNKSDKLEQTLEVELCYVASVIGVSI